MARLSAICCLVVLAAAVCVSAAGNGRTLKTSIVKQALVGKAAAVLGGAGSLSLSHGGLTLTKGGSSTGSAPAPTPAPAPAPVQQQRPQPRDQAPAAAAPAAAPVSAAPASVLPPATPVPGNSDINGALRCQSAFNAAGGRTGVEAMIGDVCQEGGANFNALGCCKKTAGVLNSGSFRGCVCNNLVYQQLCTEVKLQNLNCDNLRGQLIACGLQC